MTHIVTLPLEAVCAALVKEHDFDVSGIDQAENLVRGILDEESIDQKRLAAAMVILGWQYRSQFRHEEAERMFLQARGRFVENPFDKTRNTARATWFLAENHYFVNNHHIGRSLFWKAVAEYADTTGLFDEEARACLADFFECASGIEKDEDLAEDVEGMMDFVDFCEAQGTDGHITVVARY